MRRLLAATISLAVVVVWNTPPVSATVARTVTRAGPFAYVTVHGSRPHGVRNLRTSCPANYFITGAGANIGDKKDKGENHLGTLDILPSGRGAQTALVYRRPSDQEGSLTAICLKEPAANLLSYATGATVNMTSPGTYGLGVDCGAAGTVVGGGTTLSDSSKTTLPVNEPDPSAGVNGWLANASNSEAVTHTATAHAACLAQSITGSISVVHATKQLPINRGTTLSAWCPADTHVSGGGYDIIRPIASHPIDGPDRDAAPDDGWSVRMFNKGPSDPIPVNVYAICVQT